MFPFVVHENQTVSWIEITADKIRELQGRNNLQRLTNTTLHKSVSKDSVQALKQGRGIPCECGCNALICIGERALEVGSPYMRSAIQASRNHCYFASVACERKAMEGIAAHILANHLTGWDSAQLTQRQL